MRQLADICTKALNANQHWELVKWIFGLTVTAMEAKRKYAQTDGGKAVTKEAKKKYAQTDGGKATTRVAKKTYAQTDGGKATMKKYVQTDGGKATTRGAKKKYAQTDGGKATTREAMKKYAQTLFGKYAKQVAREKYREKLGITRRREQFRKYKQTQIDKARGGDALMRRIKFQKGVLKGPIFTCSCCHRCLYKKSVTSVTEKMKEKIRLASEEKINRVNEEKSKAKAAASEEIVISSEQQHTNSFSNML